MTFAVVSIVRRRYFGNLDVPIVDLNVISVVLVPELEVTPRSAAPYSLRSLSPVLSLGKVPRVNRIFRSVVVSVMDVFGLGAVDPAPEGAVSGPAASGPGAPSGPVEVSDDGNVPFRPATVSLFRPMVMFVIMTVVTRSISMLVTYYLFGRRRPVSEWVVGDVVVDVGRFRFLVTLIGVGRAQGWAMGGFTGGRGVTVGEGVGIGTAGVNGLVRRRLRVCRAAVALGCLVGPPVNKWVISVLSLGGMLGCRLVSWGGVAPTRRVVIIIGRLLLNGGCLVSTAATR